MGAPTARMLAERGIDVALIASPEPEDAKSHVGPFGAHYDEGRLTWLLHADPIETELSRRAQWAMQQLHERFGGLLCAWGSLFVSSPGRDEGRLEVAEADPDIDILDSAQLSTQYPFLSFPANVGGFRNRAEPSVMNPRVAVRLEQQMARDAGAAVIPMHATGVVTGRHVTVNLSDGTQIDAAKVVVAAGAFANSSGLLPKPLALRRKSECVAMAELDADAAGSLGTYPALVYQIDAPDISDVYSTPPLPYPDGKTYLKWGANTLSDQWLDTDQQLDRWYRDGDSQPGSDSIRLHMEATIPNLRASAWKTARCAVTYTAHGKPYIDEVVEDRVYVAVGGNGHSAKWCQELGSMTSQLVADGEWDASIPREPFRAVFAGEESGWDIRDLWSVRSEATR